MKDEDKTKELLTQELVELRQRVAEVEALQTSCTQMRKELEAEKSKVDFIVNSIPSGIDIVTKDYKVLFQNKIMLDVFGDCRGKLCYKEYKNKDKPCSDCPVRRAIKNRRAERTELTGADGREYEVLATPIQNPEGTLAAMGVVVDITEHKRAEKALKQREQELRNKTTGLDELNAALRVLLKRRNDDKTELEEKILVNVKQLVIPLLEKVKKRRLDSEQMGYLDLLESNLNDIISPFLRNLSAKYVNLTPTEIRVAYFIREGKTTKEIAEVMALSPRTIETHRKKIRTKLGLDKSKENLRSHLLPLQ
jgi:DNA-binding CsgD family transcriptional regulator/PAS domain-containing protein